MGLLWSKTGGLNDGGTSQPRVSCPQVGQRRKTRAGSYASIAAWCPCIPQSQRSIIELRRATQCPLDASFEDAEEAAQEDANGESDAEAEDEGIHDIYSPFGNGASGPISLRALV